MNGLQNDTNDMKELVQKVEGDVQTVMADTSGFKDAVPDLRAEVSALETTLSQILENNPGVQTDMVELQNRNNEIWRDLARFASNITQLTHDVTAVTSSVDSLSETVDSVQTNQDALQGHVTDLSGNLTRVGRNLTRTTRNIRGIETDIRALYQLNRTVADRALVGNTEFEGVKANVERVERVITQFSSFYDEELQTIKDKNAEVEANVGSLESAKEEVDEKLKEMENDVIDLKAEVESLGEEDTRFNFRLTSLATLNDEMQIGMNRLQAGITELATNASGVRRNLTNIDERVKTLSNENEAQNKRLSTNEGTISMLVNQLEVVQTALGEIEKTLGAEVDALLDNVSNLTTKYSKLEIDVDELFKVNKTELIRQLNVPIEALTEIVDDIVRTSNRNFNEVKTELAGLERNMTERFQQLLGLIPGPGVIERLREEREAGDVEVPPGSPPGSPPRPPAIGPDPPGTAPRPPAQAPALPPTTPSITTQAQLNLLRIQVNTLTSDLLSLQRALPFKVDTTRFLQLTQLVTSLENNVTSLLETVARMQRLVGEEP